MARGKSGRIVLEVDPLMKGEMYALLAKEGITLKEWFIRSAKFYISESREPMLFRSHEMPEYTSKSRRGGTPDAAI